MALKILKHKKHRVGMAILLGFIAIILLLALLINNYWSPILAQKVKSVVLTSSDSLYKADFSSAELNVLEGRITLYNITIKPDTVVYNRRKKQRLAPNNLVELHVKRLILYHIHPFKLYFKNRLDISEVILREPELHVSYQLNHTKDTVINDRRTPWQKISKSLRSIHIGNIFLDDVKLKYEDYSGNKVVISELKGMNLSARGLLIDSTTQTDRSRTLYCKEIVAELNNYSGKTPNGLYFYKISHLKLSTLTSQLNMEGLKLEPVKTDEFFSKSSKDKYTLNFDSLQLNNFDYLGYHKYRTVKASALILKKGTLALFNNPNKIKDTTINKIKTFPNIALSELSTDISIDTTLIDHFNVVYNEFNKKSNKLGTITFNNISGYFFNITNNKAALLKNNICTALLSTYFMNRGKLNVLFTFNLTGNDAAFSYKGRLGQMNLEAVNTAAMPMAMVKITSGTINQMDFDIQANSRTAKGRVTVLYNNLKVKLLEPDTPYGLKRKLVASLYANIYIIKHNNPDRAGEPPRSFNVNYLRPANSAFFNSIWQTLFSGIKPSAGLDEKTRKATEAKINEEALSKQSRIIKRMRRKERRVKRCREKVLKKQ